MNALSAGFTPKTRDPAREEAGRIVQRADIPGIARLFSNWRAEDPAQLREKIPGIVSDVIKPFWFDRRFTNIIMTAARLAAEPSENPYHNNGHFLEVFILAATFGKHAFDHERLSQHDLGLLLTSALIHDYRHDGGTNKGEQFRLEKMAFEGVRDKLIDAGANPREIEIIRAMVLATDVTKDFSNPASISPAESVKFRMRSMGPTALFPELDALYRYQITGVALMLDDADLGASLISTALCEQSSRNVAAEAKMEFTRGTSVFFLEQICHKRLFSQAGRELLQPYMDNVLHHFGVKPAVKPGVAPAARHH